QGQAELAQGAVEQGADPELAKGTLGKGDGERDREAGAAEHRLGGQLVEGQAAGGEARPGVGNPEKLQNRRDRPVFPEAAMEREERDVELALVERLDQPVVGVQLTDPVAALTQGVGDPLARAEGDLPLERQATRDDRDRAGEGHWTPPQPAGRPWSRSGSPAARPPSARTR